MIDRSTEAPMTQNPCYAPVANLKRYSTIVVDPPWAYGIWGSGSAKALVQGEAIKPAPIT